MPDQSTIYFPLRSNASALYAGPGVAGVRRRILAAGLLHDSVVLEDGLFVATAGPGGSTTMTVRGKPDLKWQSAPARGHAIGAQFHLAMRPEDAPPDAPFHPLISSIADIAWEATFEPFRRELPRSADKWLGYGHLVDDSEATELAQDWQRADRSRAAQDDALGLKGPTNRTEFASNAIVSSGYYDLAVGAVTGAAISIDRRHRIAVESRLASGEASPVAGHHALKLLLPVDIGWEDISGVRRHAAIRDYRAILREIESEAVRTSTTPADLNDRIRREYDERLARAASRGTPFRGRLVMAAIGFVVGAAADVTVPIVGGATAALGAFALSEAANRALRPRWLIVDRRLRGTRNGV